MTKEEKYSGKGEEDKESILDFEEAKEMTVGQASRKSEELEAGVTADDNVLDKYIKQHRQEIEAGKYEAKETSQGKFADTSLDLEDLIKEIRSEARKEGTSSAEKVQEIPVEDNSQVEEVEAETQPAPSLQASDELTQEPENEEDSEVTQAFSSPPLEEKGSSILESEQESEQDTLPLDDLPSSLSRSRSDHYARDDWQDEEETTPFYKRKKVIYSSLAVLALAIGGTSLFLLNQQRQAGKTKTSSSSSQTSQKSSSSSDNVDNPDLKAFNDLYDSFFTDKNKISLKNSSFSNLSKLKAALDKLKDSKEYNVAKAKYDSLVKQVEAIQAVNNQFESAAVTDGVLDSNAKVKAGAKFSEVNTGNDHLDKLLKSAISQAKGQETVAPTNPGTAASTADSNQTAEPAPSSPSTPAAGGNNQAAGTITSPTPYGGLSSAGVALQRDRSRVPYNQAVIDDANNPAWTFNPGILENILNISRQRGYITGDQFILERVNIVKGNGYYNLFKPDGTYLFSINCKTGYFVGNGPGYADSLDY
ncbi:cell division site-positioning protein MapZ family protein [Streptococcus oricebi]|uniref:Mid-cell-anchored protein Z n=1 Tax=Streptococcus oricebi TaxID=1547447 RepID=A0ABS5B3Q6_9STRE|nr:cell division site-positioning protein MapZ family protein [Streptococcus oricebi]MBP2623458.1 Holliday junction resolvase [Streptococcus oricebi]